jgi:hypothetical protein
VAPLKRPSRLPSARVAASVRDPAAATPGVDLESAGDRPAFYSDAAAAVTGPAEPINSRSAAAIGETLILP